VTKSDFGEAMAGERRKEGREEKAIKHVYVTFFLSIAPYILSSFDLVVPLPPPSLLCAGWVLSNGNLIKPLILFFPNQTSMTSHRL